MDIGCRDEASFSSPHLLARLLWLDAQETPSCNGAENAQAIGARISIDTDPAQLLSRVDPQKMSDGITRAPKLPSALPAP